MTTKKSATSKKAASSAPELATTYEPTEREIALLTNYAAQRKTKPPVPRMKAQPSKGATHVRRDHPEEVIWFLHACATFGTTNMEFAHMLADQAASIGLRGGSHPTVSETTINGTFAAVAGIAPRDETEAMLALQMVATHNAAMEMLKRATLDQTTVVAESLINRATKLARTYAAQVEALSRYRGKGQQKVVVEHVHVHSGGQAIVGNVASGGRGAPSEHEVQPHAPIAITHEPVAPLLCPDPERQAVPVARGQGQNPLSNARRRQG